MTQTRMLSLMQWVGWVLIALLCLVVGLLWSRMERQVARNAADIVMLKAYSDAEDLRAQQEASEERARLERRWGQYLMPTLRQQHEAIQSLARALAPEYVQPLPDWLPGTTLMARAHRQKPKSFSVSMLLTMGIGSMAVLGGLVWLALAYNHSALLAVLLPILPVLFSFFVEQCRGTLEEWREDNGDEDSETAEE